jgi:hypothetical protein
VCGAFSHPAVVVHPLVYCLIVRSAIVSPRSDLSLQQANFIPYAAQFKSNGSSIIFWLTNGKFFVRCIAPKSRSPKWVQLAWDLTIILCIRPHASVPGCGASKRPGTRLNAAFRIAGGSDVGSRRSGDISKCDQSSMVHTGSPGEGNTLIWCGQTQNFLLRKRDDAVAFLRQSHARAQASSARHRTLGDPFGCAADGCSSASPASST